jgi:antitoxin CptB
VRSTVEGCQRVSDFAASALPGCRTPPPPDGGPPPLDGEDFSPYMASSRSRLDRQSGLLRMELSLDQDDRLKRLRFRAWHRGTREADLLIGGYFDAASGDWDEADMAWFEALLEEHDVDIMAWAIGTADPPERFAGPLMRRLRTVNYIRHPE